MFEGTHFKPVTREQVDIGQGLVVHGRVLAAPDCRTIPGARIAHWQAGEKGRYVDHLRAWLVSGIDGSYRFETEWPALSVPHIHFTVTAEGYRPVTTQWVGDAPVERVEFDIILLPE
jgi:protocatechuate 3,4-dioxygenase beta subunit